MADKRQRTWSGVITRTTSGTIEVEVEASSNSFNAECEEDEVHGVKEDK